MRLAALIRNGFISLCCAALALIFMANHNFFLFCEPSDQDEHFFQPDDMIKRKLQASNQTTKSIDHCVPLFSRNSKQRVLTPEMQMDFPRQVAKVITTVTTGSTKKVVAFVPKKQQASTIKEMEIVTTASLTANVSLGDDAPKDSGVPDIQKSHLDTIKKSARIVVMTAPEAGKQDAKEAAKANIAIQNTAMTVPLVKVVPLMTISIGQSKNETDATTEGTTTKTTPPKNEAKHDAKMKEKFIDSKVNVSPIKPTVEKLVKTTVKLLHNSVLEQNQNISKIPDSSKDLPLPKPSLDTKQPVTTSKKVDPSDKKTNPHQYNSSNAPAKTVSSTSSNGKKPVNETKKGNATKEVESSTKPQRHKDSQPPSKSDSVSSTNEKTPTKQTKTSDAAKIVELSEVQKDGKVLSEKVSSIDNKSAKKEKLLDSSLKSKLDKSTTNKDKPMNILILYPDDWRHDTIGAAGTQPVITPFLDSLAKEGVRFTHNCVTTSICWISRATLATGQYLARHKSESVKNPIFYNYWNETWQGLLRDNGYYTGHIGKWQYRNYSFVSDHHDFTRLYEGTHWVQKRGEAKIAATDACRNDTIEFLRDRPKDRPFALTVAFYPPKAIGSASEQWFPKKETRMLYENITIPEPKDWNASYYKLPEFFRIKNEARNRWNQRFSTSELYQNSMKNYYALITQVDEACKDIVDELKVQGLLNDTLIIFTTDNGFFHGEHGLAGKWFPYQESIRVPLIIRDPRMPKSKIGTLDDSFTLNIDLASTIIGAAKLPIPNGIQGRDMSDLYMSPDGKKSWRKEFYYEHPSLGSKYIPASTALVRKDFKYVYYREFRLEQLFNLAVDPLETEDLSNRTEHAALLKKMREKHNEYKEIVK